MANEVRSALIDLAREHGSDWIGEMAVWLGNLDGVVDTGVSGKYYARQANGQVITVSNAAKVAPIFDLHVLVRRSRIQPNIWQITEVIEDYSDPAEQGLIAHHAEQHEEEGSDRIMIDRKQVKQLSVRVSGTWDVNLYGATVPTATGIALVDNQTIDLSSYAISAGAKYVSIEVDDSGTVSIHEGAVFASPSAATVDDIPVPDPGKYLLAYVLFYEGQEELVDDNIRVPMPLPIIGKSSGLQISEADPDTPDDADLFGFWDVTDEELKSIEWIDLVALLTAIFDLLYEPLGGGGSGSGGASGHLHGLARWNGASGQTTFDLPDVAEYIDSIMINGLEEDPLVYTLSSDRTQIVLDTALSSDSNVIAHYVIASI